MIEQEPPSWPGLSKASPATGSTKVDCTETVLRIFEFLDGEMGADDCRRMQAHLDECEPCLREYQMDQALKMVIKRSCGCEAAPVELRTTILRRLTMVRIETTDY
ncbi:MAG TPA: mycothiol system anti-sigma-R factor [Lapillicoccus sp.]|nr:mycothiol system anti-sigma-R factor [Lapillicoccus sp.]